VLNESLMAVSPHRKFGFFPVVGGVYCGGGMVKLLLLRGISGDGGFSGWYVRLVLLLGSFPRLLMLSALMDCRWHWTASSSSSLDDGMADGRSTKMMRRVVCGASFCSISKVLVSLGEAEGGLGGALVFDWCRRRRR
jgi:hypothetical protein